MFIKIVCTPGDLDKYTLAYSKNCMGKFGTRLKLAI